MVAMQPATWKGIYLSKITACPKNTMKIILKIAGMIFIGLAAYETFAVIQARSHSPGIFQAALAQDNIAINLQSIPEDRINALLSVQDPTFYSHRGFDFNTPGAGLTTITQALVKFLYFDDFRPGFQNHGEYVPTKNSDVLYGHNI